jgi:hypothetical protein
MELLCDLGVAFLRSWVGRPGCGVLVFWTLERLGGLGCLAFLRWYDFLGWLGSIMMHATHRFMLSRAIVMI